MIFNVNAAAVAALALTMAVHAAPSPVAHVLQDIAGCDNINDRHDADFGNHHDDVDRSAVIRVSAGDRDEDSRANSNRASDSSRQTDTNRASDESRRTDTNRANDGPRQTDTNRASDGPRQTDTNRASDNSRTDSDRARLVDARVLVDSNRASDESRRTDTNRASDDSRRTDSNRASDESRRTESIHASESLVDAHRDIQTTHRNIDDDARNRDARETRDNSRCDDCKSEFWHEGGVLRRAVGALSQTTHVLRVEHLTKRCSPEESARRCGPNCNGFIGGWNRDKSLFDLLFLDNAIHGIPSEADVLLSQQREDGWEPQFRYEC
ncbi:hypothetical protein ARMGADRAFT_489536 [Armillaria gallica]|uniref:Uncharacterized protein n=1 Tax=Armillaria gallica TaxID=47427 RepID=A0A2H3DV49_ARMGA|nr:hypothetical protein ARMGADRAFT_1025385 [Armillaria gallica]PBK99089.1 hypothetical protein ARMGADRAFT_489536 [Armillaria gallica]